MSSDTSTEELIEFAAKIGLKEEWIQVRGTWHEHFDVSQSKKKLAIKHGAIPINSRGLVKMMKELKKNKES
ncbi:hypothetical protein CYANOKiyG1_27390 [Okeania sp. KiyG1]|nr:hypothetical protein CYANOKiyG1_27390 [Okeania sp. KiyG1]